MRRFRTGNRMVVEGALASGCRFFAGYPITPASSIYKTMMRELPARGGVALSAPDEISSLCYCVGASLRGLKAMTATSGPGWALMIETFQYALMTETPLVVALVQRLGPSTGGATQGAQGDVLLAEFATSGAYTVPVFAPSSASECFELTREAFDWSERLRTPVILLSDKEVGMTAEAVDVGDEPGPPPVDRPRWQGDGAYLPYSSATPDGVPGFLPVGAGVPVTVTGSAHDKHGHLRKNAPEVLEGLRRLERKVRAHAHDMASVNADLQAGARHLVISFGITARAARQAVRDLRTGGERVSFVQVRSLFPVPEDDLRRAAAGARTVWVAEENLTGQYRGVLTPLLGHDDVRGINAIGTLISPGTIVRELRAASNHGGKRAERGETTEVMS